MAGRMILQERTAIGCTAMSSCVKLCCLRALMLQSVAFLELLESGTLMKFAWRTDDVLGGGLKY